MIACFASLTCLLQIISIGIISAIFHMMCSTNSEYLSSIIKNWTQSPVLYVNSSGAPCSNEEDFLFNDFWEGTVAGCNTLVELFRNNYCPFSSMYVPPAPRIEYKKWKGKYFCGRRTGVPYLNLSLAEKTCPEGEKPCGIADTMLNILCVKNTSHCPLNDMRFIREDSLVNNETESEAFTKLKLVDGEMYSSNMNTAGKIVTEFKFSEGQPCADPSFINLFSTPYLLDIYYDKSTCKEKIGNYSEDFRYEVVDRNSKYTFLKEHYILSILHSFPLSYTGNFSQVNITLFTRGYLGLAAKCHNKVVSSGLSMDTVTQLPIKMDAIKALVIASLCITTFSATVCIINIGAIFEQSDYAEKKTFSMAMSVHTSLACLVTITLNSLHCAALFALIKDFYFLYDPLCVDDLTYQAVSRNLGNAPIVAILSIVITSINFLILCNNGVIFCLSFRE